jgi:hypothetical protein
MTKTLKASALALALASVIGITTAAHAVDAVVTFDPGTVQYGYSDGYWSKSKEWHAWEKPEHVDVYRKVPDAQYHEWAHTRDSDQGWIEPKK